MAALALKRQKSVIEAILARAASFLAQAVSFHLFSISATSIIQFLSKHTILVSSSYNLGLSGALQRSDEISEIEASDLGNNKSKPTYRDLLSLHTSGRSIDQDLSN